MSVSRSLRAHWPTLLVAVGFVLALLSAGSSGHRHFAGKFDVERFEALFEADYATVEGRAAELLRESDGLQWPQDPVLDPETAMRGVSQILDRDTLKALARDHSPEEIVAFAEAGAPLVTWRVAYFRPFEYARDRKAVRITVDRAGRVIGSERGEYKPTGTRSLPSDAWVAKARANAAGALRMDEERLQPLSKDAIPIGTRIEYSDALWRIDGLELGKYSVVVGAWDYSQSVGFRAQVIELQGEDAVQDEEGWGVAPWVAAVLTLVMAMLFGVWTQSRDDAAPSPDALLLPGFALGVLMALSQVGLMLSSRHGYHLGVLVVFLVVAIVLATAGTVFARTLHRGALEPPSRRVGLALVGLAIAAFVASCLLCGGPFASGCCERCGILRCSVAPLVIAALLLARTKPRFAADAMLLSFVTLTPHCICDNLVNHHWMMAIGTSPMCFFLFHGTALTALIGLRGVFSRVTLALGVLALLVTGTLAYTHHVYHFPW